MFAIFLFVRNIVGKGIEYYPIYLLLGLIMFDLELKRAGLVAQVSKTSVHEIEDIDKEVNRLRFFVTDPSGDGSSSFLVATPTLPRSEQAESVADYV